MHLYGSALLAIFLVIYYVSNEVSSAQGGRITKVINDFGLNFYKALKQLEEDGSKKNILHCPLSTVTSLGMLLAGARNETEAQILGVLGRSGLDLLDRAEPSRIHQQIKETLDNLEQATSGKDTKLVIKDLILVKNRLNLLEQFKEIIEANYNGMLRQIDFGSDEAIKWVNEWVRNETNNKIKSILSDIPSETKMLILNSVYLNAKWREQFDTLATDQDIFYNEDGSESRVNMMSIRSMYKIAHLQEKRIHLVQLPYIGKLSMIIILPHARESIDGVMNSLSNQQLNWMMNQMKVEEISLSMPKFELDTKIDLRKILTKMGLITPFTNAADFSGMFNGNETANMVKVDEAVQKVSISVSEEGTEAVAVTGMRLMPRSGFFGPTVEINHPFAFIIRDDLSGVHVFSGIVKHLNSVDEL